VARKPAAAAHVTEVYLELGTKRVFACAYEFPGLCRSARYEDMALAALVSAVPRYATVAKTAGSPPPTDTLEVIERVAGSVSTDFGVPGTITSRDREPLTAAETRRVLALVAAAWTILDHTAAGAPQELTKGPRGGGRDRFPNLPIPRICSDQLAHVSGGEASLKWTVSERTVFETCRAYQHRTSR